MCLSVDEKMSEHGERECEFFFSTLSTQSVFTHVASSQQICCDKKKIVYRRIEFNSNRTGLDTNMAALLFIYFLFATPPWWLVTVDVFPVYFSGGEKLRPEIGNTSAFAGYQHGGGDLMSKGCIN